MKRSINFYTYAFVWCSLLLKKNCEHIFDFLTPFLRRLGDKIPLTGIKS